MDDADRLALRLTRWFQWRIRESQLPPCAGTRLYGLEVIDPDGLDRLDPAAVRVAFIGEGDDESALLQHPSSRRAFDFDAAATVAQVWRPPAAGVPRPGSFRGRRREVLVRVVAVRQ